MGSLERTAKRAKNKRKGDLSRRQARAISKGLNNLRLQQGELADSTKTLFDMIALFQITMTDEQIDYYTENNKYVVVSLDDPSPDPKLSIRKGVIYFPMFTLQVQCMINTVGARSTIYLMGNDESKYLAVNSFLKFFDMEEQLKITGYYVARELAAYFNSLGSEVVDTVPPVALSDSIGELSDTEFIEA